MVRLVIANFTTFYFYATKHKEEFSTMEKTTERRKFGIRDIMTIAAMMVITYLVAMVIGSVTLPFPVV